MIQKILLLLLLFIVSAEVHGQDAIDVIPNEVLFKSSNQHNFSISPNGQYFAQAKDNRFSSEIVIVDIDKYRRFNSVYVLGRAENFYWLSNSRLVIESRGGIYAINIDGSDRKKIVGSVVIEKINWLISDRHFRYNSIINLLPAKENHILIETHNESFIAAIKQVNLITGNLTRVIDGTEHKINRFITDIDGMPRLGMRYLDDGIEVISYNQFTDSWQPFFIKINGKNYPLSTKGASYLSQSVTLESFSVDKDIIYISSNVDSDKRQLLSYDIAKREVVEILVSDTNCDVVDPMEERLRFIFDYSRGKMAGVRYESLTPQFKWLEPSFAEMHGALNKQYPGFVHDVLDSDIAGNRFIINQWSDQNAGNIGVFDRTDNSYAVMFHFNNELNDYTLTSSKSTVFRARDNHPLPGYVNLPISYNKETLYPAVIIPHGGPWARDYWSMESFSQYFSSRGYITLRVNFRGSTGFGQKHLTAGISGMNTIMIDDIADATKQLLTLYNIDPNRVFLYGHSYGGYATYMGLVRYPDLYSAGVAVSAPTDMKLFMKTLKRKKNDFAYDFWEVALGSKDAEYLENISPIEYVENITKPLLILHGEKDEIIDVKHAEIMNKALSRKNKDVNLEIFPYDGHNFENENSLGDLLDFAELFFKKSTKKSNN